MPVIFVYGIPMRQRQLKELADDLKLTTATLPELQITKDQVSVFFPSDRLSRSRGEEIIIFIYLHDKPERTPEVLKRLRTNIGSRVKTLYFPDALVECRTQSDDPDQWWSSAQ